MKYVIDRIEEMVAVCRREDGVLENIALELLYDGAAEGDHFCKGEAGAAFLPEETAAARRRNVQLQKMLFED